jgi:hypothetical protein
MNRRSNLTQRSIHDSELSSGPETAWFFAALLEQAKTLLADLTAMKQNPKLPAADKTKVDALITKATSVDRVALRPGRSPACGSGPAARTGASHAWREIPGC